MGTKSIRPGRRGVMCDAGASGKRRNTPGEPICPTLEAGRFWPPPASFVA
jgi:hypothetical protein